MKYQKNRKRNLITNLRDKPEKMFTKPREKQNLD
jgi:hypothetical protein